MITPELLEYIRQELARGVDPDALRLALLERGWNESDVASALREAQPAAPPLYGNGQTTPITPEHPKPEELPRGAITLLRETFSVYKKQFLVLITLGAIPLLFTLPLAGFNSIRKASFIAASNIAANIFVPAGFTFLLILFFFAAGWSFVALLCAIRDRSARIGIVESHRRAWGHIMPFWWITIIVTCIVIGGTFLLIIPSIIFCVWFLFAQFVLVAENTKGLSVLMRSKAYVAGWWGGVFWRVMLFGILFSLSAAAVFGMSWGIVKLTDAAWIETAIVILFSILVGPIPTIYCYLLYEDLKTLKGETAPPERRGQKFLFGLIGTFGLLVVPVSLVAVSIWSVRYAEKLGMDTQRHAHILQMKLALDVYRQNEGLYPPSLSLLAPDIIPTVPHDPKTDMPYTYEQLEGGMDFRLCAVLENSLE